MRDSGINDKVIQSPTSISISDSDSQSNSHTFSNLGNIPNLGNIICSSILRPLPSKDPLIMAKLKTKTKKKEVDTDEEVNRLLYQNPTTTTASSSHANALDFADIDPDRVSDIPEGGNFFLLDEGEEEVTSEDRTDWIPVTEVGLRRRFEPRFDTDDSFYSVVAHKISSLKNIDLRKLHHLGNFPTHIQFRKAGIQERLCSSIDDQDWIPFSGDYILLGLRYPFPDFLVTMLNHYGIAITQLPPNGVMEIICFAAWCRRNLVVESPDLFRKFYSLAEHRVGSGSYYLKSATGAPTIFRGKPTSRKDWKEKLFFIRSADPARPLPFRGEWRKVEPKDRSAWSPSQITAISAKLHSPKLPLDISAWTSPEVLSYLGIYKIKLTRAQAKATQRFMRTITKYRAPGERVGGENQQVSRPGLGRVLLKLPAGDGAGTAYSREAKKDVVIPIYDLCAREGAKEKGKKKDKSPIPAEEEESSAEIPPADVPQVSPSHVAIESDEETPEDGAALIKRGEKRRVEIESNLTLTPISKRARSARPSPSQVRSDTPVPVASARAESSRRHPPRRSPPPQPQHPGRAPQWPSRQEAAKRIMDYNTAEDAARAYYEIEQPDFPIKYCELVHRKKILDLGLLTQNNHVRKVLEEQDEQILAHKYCTVRISNLEKANEDLNRKYGRAQTRISELTKEQAAAQKLKVSLEKKLEEEKKERTARQADVSLLNDQLKALNAKLAEHRSDPSLVAEKEVILDKKEAMSASVSASQDTSDLLREQISGFQAKIDELERQLAASETTVAELRRSHLTYLRNWVKSEDYLEACAYTSYTTYTLGYAAARHAIFKVLKQLGLADQLNIGDFRSYPNERMFEDGRTLRRPITKRPAINPPGTSQEDLEYDEWEKPYPSAQPVEGELMDLDPSVYEELEATYRDYLGPADQAQVTGPEEATAEQLMPVQEIQDVHAQGGENEG